MQLVKVEAAEINLEFAQQREKAEEESERAEKFSSSAPYLMVGFINFL